jgi:hypothetical protein
MALLFRDEKINEKNPERKNLIFLAYPFSPALPMDEYRQAMKELQNELPVRLWYFADEQTTAELIRKIWRAILQADLAFFDISNGNANVAFEMGLAAGIDKRCVTLLKTGASNPLGSADLGYSERLEYHDAESLKAIVRKALHAHCSGLIDLRSACAKVGKGTSGISSDELFSFGVQVLNHVFKNKKITKKVVVDIVGDSTVATYLLKQLRQDQILRLEGEKRGATYVFCGTWTHDDHSALTA